MRDGGTRQRESSSLDDQGGEALAGIARFLAKAAAAALGGGGGKVLEVLGPSCSSG